MKANGLGHAIDVARLDLSDSVGPDRRGAEFPGPDPVRRTVGNRQPGNTGICGRPGQGASTGILTGPAGPAGGPGPQGRAQIPARRGPGAGSGPDRSLDSFLAWSASSKARRHHKQGAGHQARGHETRAAANSLCDRVRSCDRAAGGRSSDSGDPGRGYAGRGCSRAGHHHSGNPGRHGPPHQGGRSRRPPAADRRRHAVHDLSDRHRRRAAQRIAPAAGGRRPGRQARGRQGRRRNHPATDRMRNPGHGPHRAAAAVGAPPRRLPRARADRRRGAPACFPTRWPSSQPERSPWSSN